MSKIKSIGNNQQYKLAIKKVRAWVSKTRKRKHEAIIGEVSKVENIIKYFFDKKGIDYGNKNKKDLQRQLLEIYIGNHPFFEVKPKKTKLDKNFERYWNDPFFSSDDWQKLRKAVLKCYGATCMKCGTTKKVMHVDHIKPRSKYPELKFDFTNLQVLCCDCNVEKSNIDETDYRNIAINITINN